MLEERRNCTLGKGGTRRRMWRAEEDGGMRKRYCANATTATILPSTGSRRQHQSEVTAELIVGELGSEIYLRYLTL